MAYQRFYDVVRDAYGNTVAGASISVYNTGTTTLSTIYSASGGVAPSATANPLTSASDGSYGFAAVTGTYDIVITANGLPTRYLNNVSILGDMTSYSGTLYASSINNVPAGNIASTDVQSALNELDTEKAIDANVVHLSGGETITGVKAFSAQPTGIAGTSISNTPAGNVTSNTVQAAINELDTKKAIDTLTMHLAGTESVTGIKTFSAVTTVSNATVSTASTNGALVVTGGLGVGGRVSLGTGTATVAPMAFTAGTNLTSAIAGGVEFDGVQVYNTIDTTSGRGCVPVEQYYHLTANGSTISTIANFFGTTSNPSLVANAYYELEIVCFFSCSTAGTVVWTLTNSAAPTSQSIYFEMCPATGVVAPPGTATMLVGQVVNDSTATLALTATAALSDATNYYTRMKIMLMNGTGTSLKIQATKSAGWITPLRGSYWRLRRLSPNNIGTFSA